MQCTWWKFATLRQDKVSGGLELNTKEKEENNLHNILFTY